MPFYLKISQNINSNIVIFRPSRSIRILVQSKKTNRTKSRLKRNIKMLQEKSEKTFGRTVLKLFTH